MKNEKWLTKTREQLEEAVFDIKKVFKVVENEGDDVDDEEEDEEGEEGTNNFSSQPAGNQEPGGEGTERPNELDAELEASMALHSEMKKRKKKETADKRMRAKVASEIGEVSWNIYLTSSFVLVSRNSCHSRPAA